GRAEGEVDLISADREIVFVDAVAVRDIDEAAVADAGPPDDVRDAPGEAGAFGEDVAKGAEAVALADGAVDRDVLPLERPVEAVGDARRVFPPVVTGEAI